MSKNKQEDIRKGIYRLMSPEEIDTFIKAKIKALSPKGRFKGMNPMATHWTEAEKQVRSGVVLDYIGQGLSKRRTMEELCERWEIGMDTARKYYDLALEELNCDDVIESIRNKYIERLERMVEYCAEKGDMQNALKAQEQLNKIGGFYTERKQVEVSGDEIKFKFGD